MNISELFSSKQTAREENKPAENEPQKTVPFATNMLVVVDGSESSYVALEHAGRMVSCLPGAKLTAVFVIDTASMDMLQQMRVFVSEERALFEAEMEIKGQRVLDVVYEKAKKHGIEADTYLLKGRISQVVLRAARELKCDMIVMNGWHDASTRKDNSSVERQLLLDHAECPVVVVKNSIKLK